MSKSEMGFVSVHNIDFTIDHSVCEKVRERESFYNHRCRCCLTEALSSTIDGLKDFSRNPSYWFENDGDDRNEEYDLTDMTTADDINNHLEYEAFDAITDTILFRDDDIQSFFMGLFDGDEYSATFIGEIAEKLEAYSIEACRIIMLNDE